MDKEYSDSEKLKKRERELSIINNIARDLSTHTNLDYAINSTLNKVAELLDLDTGWIFLIDEKTEKTYLAAFLNLPPVLLDNKKLLEGTCYCLELYQNNSLNQAENINVITCSRLYNIVGNTNGLRFHASIPISTNNKKIGVLNVASTNWRELSKDDLKILYTIGDLLAIAIERANLFSKSAMYGAIEERYRLARELHDNLGQGMTAVILRLETLAALIESGADEKKLNNTIDYTLKLARSNLEEARRSVLNLRAQSLEDKTLKQAVDKLIIDLSAQGGIKINFDISDNYNLNSSIETSIYRMIQESLNNVIKHANAKNVKVNLNITSSISLIIEDNGIGFELSELTNDRHGLIGLNERVKLLKGSLDITTSLGNGTKLTFSIPLEHKND